MYTSEMGLILIMVNWKEKWLYMRKQGKKLYRKGTKGINDVLELKVFEPPWALVHTV
jgi:hypothetical protein